MQRILSQQFVCVPRRLAYSALFAAHRGARQVAHWYRNYRTRQLLLRLDGRMLRDVGITPSEAQQEGRKPFWID